MARRRKSKKKKHPLPDPVAVLSGRSDVRVQELFELIHRANPTGRELPAREEARRYEQKSRLQSLLVRRFGDQHLVVRESDREGIVSLEHRSGTKDACHAVLGELEADARAWVQRRLDAAPDGDEHDLRTGDRGPAGDRAPRLAGEAAAEAAAEPRELVELARRELDEYDYEAAEQHLRLAFERSHGSVEAALPLLELLAGVLGMDRQALELEPRLAAEASADPRVRTSLALAAARLDESEHALRLVAGTDTPQTAEVYAALATWALRDRCPEVAAEYLDHVSRHDPTHPRILSLTQEIAELQDEMSLPAEQALERRFREAGSLAVEHEARSLLARRPASEVARRVLREVAAHRRQAEIAKHLELAESALGQERFRHAADHFQAARDAGSERADLPELIERAREQERRRRHREQVDAVAGGFERGDPKAALLAYLGLTETLRDRVRKRVGRPQLDWLEELGPPPSKTRAQEAVAAVLAFDRARRDLPTAGAGAALDVLKPHLETLHGVATARRWLRDVRCRFASERRQRAQRMLEDARGAHDAADFERAERLLDGLSFDRLARRDQAQARRLLRRLRRSRERQLLEQELERHLAADDTLGALERARRLSERAEEAAEQERRSRLVADLRRRLRGEWHVEETTDQLPLDQLYDFDPYPGGYEAPQVWLDEDGRELLLVDAWDRWLFIRAVDLAHSMVTARVSLRTPEPMGPHLQDVCRDGERLLIAGDGGHLLEIARDGWQILSWRSLRELLPEKAVLEQVQLIPASRYLWLVFTTPPADAWRCYVVDQRTWRIARKLAGNYVLPILTSPAGVLSSPWDEGAKLYSARGKPGSELGLSPATRVLCAAGAPAASPGGGGLWLLAADLHDEDAEHAELLELGPAADGSLEIRTRLRIAELFRDGTQQLATLSDRENGFLLLTNPKSDTELLAITGSPDGLKTLYRSPVPSGAVLVQDRYARRAAAVYRGERSITVHALSPEPSVPSGFGTTTRRRDSGVPDLRPPYFCTSSSGTKAIVLRALMDEIGRSDFDAVRRRFERRAGIFSGTTTDLTATDLCLAMRLLARGDPRWTTMARELSAKEPEDPAAALLAAEAAVERGRWDEAARRLSAVDPQGLDDGRGCHFHHLLGVAHLRLGESPEAIAAFEKGLQYEDGICVLEPAIELARPMSDPPEPAEWGPEQPLVRQLLGAVRVADHCLDRGDLRAARAALERPEIRHAGELQSAARLAEVYLRLPIDDRSATAERFSKRLACAYFLEVRSGQEIIHRELDLPGIVWQKSRLDDLAKRARAWLES